ncbi:MAG: hypothetical protein U0Q16_29065 [Bryobacteraceae bacterium]
MGAIISIIASNNPGIRSRVFRALADFGTITANRVSTEISGNLHIQIAFQWREAGQAGQARALLADIPGIVEVTESAGSLPELTDLPSTDIEEGEGAVRSGDAAVRTPGKKSGWVAAVAAGVAICAFAGVAWFKIPSAGERTTGPSVTPAVAPSTVPGIEIPATVEPEAATAVPDANTAMRTVPAAARAQKEPAAAPRPAPAAKPAPFVPPSSANSAADAPSIPAPPSVAMTQANPPAPVAALPRVEQVQPQPAPPQPVEAAKVQPAAPSPAPTLEGQAPLASGSASGPRPVRRVEPTIPASLKKSLRSDVTISVKVYVGANGDVVDTVPMRVGDPAADQMAAVAAAAVRRWQFEPARQNGQAHAGQTIVRFRISK